jgi:hypothetical protein
MGSGSGSAEDVKVGSLLVDAVRSGNKHPWHFAPVASRSRFDSRLFDGVAGTPVAGEVVVRIPAAAAEDCKGAVERVVPSHNSAVMIGEPGRPFEGVE